VVVGGGGGGGVGGVGGGTGCCSSSTTTAHGRKRDKVQIGFERADRVCNKSKGMAGQQGRGWGGYAQ